MDIIQATTTKFADAHCHVDLYSDPLAFARDRAATRIPTVAVTNAPSVFFYTKELSIHNQFIIPAVGLHPELAYSHAAELTILLEIIEAVSVVGEIGLDFTEQDEEIRAVQRQVFSTTLARCADVGHRILTIHSRRAAAETISMIGANYPGSIILHWFSGSVRDARQAVKNGYYFSVNCAMSRSERGRRLLAELPPNRVITETDGPFMDCCSGGSLGTHVIAELSRLWKQAPDEVSNRLFDNFWSVFSDRFTK